MLRAKNPPPILPFKFPDLDRPACSARVFNNYSSAWPSSSERAMPRFWRGSSAAVVRGGGALASTAAAAPSFLGGYLVFQASILFSTYFLQGHRLCRRLHPASPSTSSSRLHPASPTPVSCYITPLVHHITPLHNRVLYNTCYITPPGMLYNIAGLLYNIKCYITPCYITGTQPSR
jgi:hypothetical protein